jgi:hypothetical protein
MLGLYRVLRLMAKVTTRCEEKQQWDCVRCLGFGCVSRDELIKRGWHKLHYLCVDVACVIARLWPGKLAGTRCALAVAVSMCCVHCIAGTMVF